MSNNNANQKKQLILIVDDDASIRMTAKMVLELQGYSTLEADSAEACLNICQQQAPDLILLDAVMPGMDGFNCSLRLILNPILIPTLYIKENLTNDNELNF